MSKLVQSNYKSIDDIPNNDTVRTPSSEENSESNSLNLNKDTKPMIKETKKVTHKTAPRNKSKTSIFTPEIKVTNTDPIKTLKEFDDQNVMNVAESLPIVEKKYGEINIAYSMSKSSKAIDDLIDFKSKTLKPGNRSTGRTKETLDPMQYEKLRSNKDPEPMIIMPEFTPHKLEDEIKKKKDGNNDIDINRTPLIKFESEIYKNDTNSGLVIKETLNAYINTIDEEPTNFLDIEERQTHEELMRSKFMDLCQKGEWGNVEQLLRSYNKENPLPNFRDLEMGETPLMLACKENRLVIVDRLLEMDVDVNEKTADGTTALHLSARYANDDIIKLLISKQADPNAFGSSTKCLPIHLACSRTSCPPGVLQCLLKATQNARLQMDKNGAIPLMYAIESRSINSIKELLTRDKEKQTNIKKKNSGDTAVHIACRKKDLDALRLLSEVNAPINIQNDSGETALHICAEENDETILKYLYTNKANANIVDNLDRTALHMAAEKGNTKIVEFLIDKFKCNVLTRDKDGNTLMHVTSIWGHPETTMSFLKRGVPLHMPNKSGSVCLHAAVQSGHANVVRALLDKGAKVNARTKDLYTPLHIAVKYGHPNVVETLLGCGSQVNVKGGVFDESPLHIAAMQKGGERCAEMLLKSGANVNETNKKGETALHIAARTGNLEMLNSLLNEGGNPTLVCNEGNSALHIAVRYCHFPIVQELINFINRTKSRIDVTLLVNSPNNEFETTLHFAAELEKKRAHVDFEDTDIMKLLLEYDGDMKIQTKHTNEIPLHYCAHAGNTDILLEIVNFLEMKIHQVINKQAKNGWSPLLFASEKGHHHFVNILLKNNARVDVFDEHGMTALHLAAEKGHMEVADILLANKAFVNAKSKGGLTPLHLAAQNGFKKLVEMLITQHNATNDALTLNRKTPLHLAAQYGKKAVCESLLYEKNSPADPNASDSKGQTPLHLAAKNDHSDVVRLFLRFKPELLIKANYDSDGMTCGHIAAANGCLSVIKEFMRFHKSIILSWKNKSTGSASLHLASEGGHYKVVKVLLDAGAKPTEENNDGMTCLHLAAKYGHIKLLSCLKPKMNLKIVSQKSGMTPLHIAAHYGQIDFVREMIVDVPANIKSERPKTGEQIKDVLTESGLTPLHLAAQSGHENLVRLLLNCSGVDVNCATKNNGLISLHFAAQNGHTNVASLLISKSATQISRMDLKGRTALHFATSHGHFEMAELFIGQGSEINAPDYMGFTPLHYAAKSGYLKVCKLLVQSGASCEVETKDFKIPLVLATHFNHTDVVSFLLRNNHSMHQLLEDDRFLFDLMICSKLNNFKSLEELILLSPAPVEFAAKLANEYSELSEKEKERSKDLVSMEKHCATLCTDLVALAAVEKGADKLLTAIDNRGVSLLDILIENEQKEVISHPSVQRYLSDVWIGDMNWPMWKFMLLFLFLFLCPIVWLCAMFPFGKRWFKSPVLKFMLYLISHLYLTCLFLYISIWEIYPCYRVSSLPNWYEWLLLICLSGLLVSELVNPVDRNSIAILKNGILFIGFAATLTHILTIFNITTTSMVELIYIRNQFLGFGTCMCFVVTLDFMSIHHLFGPWTIIIRNLITVLFKFIVILFIFLLSFATIHFGTFQSTVNGTDPTTVPNLWARLLILFFALFGQANAMDDPITSATPSYSIYITRAVFGINVMITIVVLTNLFIAMLEDTYASIQEESDTEWKFGRAKLIRNMKKTTPLPSPFILLTQFVLYCTKFYYLSRNLPMPEYIDKQVGLDINLRRKSQISPNIIENVVASQSNEPELLKDVVNWLLIVRRYLSIRKVEDEGESLTPEDFPD